MSNFSFNHLHQQHPSDNRTHIAADGSMTQNTFGVEGNRNESLSFEVAAAAAAAEFCNLTTEDAL